MFSRETKSANPAIKTKLLLPLTCSNNKFISKYIGNHAQCNFSFFWKQNGEYREINVAK